MVGEIDGDHCERDQLFCTNTVSGWPLRIVLMPVTCQPSSSAPRRPDAPRRTARPTPRSRPSCAACPSRTVPCCSPDRSPGRPPSCRSSSRRRTWTPASCPRCATRCTTTAARDRCASVRRSSTMSARYQESPSLLFNSIVPKLRFGRGSPAAKNGRPSGPARRRRDVDVGVAEQVPCRATRRSRASRRTRPGSARCTLDVPHVKPRVLKVPLHRPDRVADPALERRVRERRVRR